MARLPRLDVPHIPQHIVQRGNNRNALFFADGHRRMYLALLHDAACVAEVALHAYVLMSNHVHLLATPTRAGAISTMMQRIGRSYALRINRQLNRSGTLFEGRYRSGPVQTERYLLCCHRYIELNPVRAGMVADPADYGWSSFRSNGLGEPDPVLTPHASYLALGGTSGERRRAYRRFVAEGVADEERDAIRAHLSQGRVLGSAEFQRSLQRPSGRPTAVNPRGRPRKTPIPAEENVPDPFF